jgi:integrase
MGLFTRPNSPYYWKRYDINPETGKPFRPRASTKIFVGGSTKAQRDKNQADAEHQYMQDCIDIRKGIERPTAAAPIYTTYGAWIRDYYLAHYTAHHRGKVNERSTLNRLVAEFGTLPIEAITTARVDAYRDRRAQDVTVNTINRDVQVLQVSLRRMAHALRDAGCAAPDPRDILTTLTRRKPLETETRWFSEDEFAKFVAAIDAHDTIGGTSRAEGLALATAAIETLLRRGSLLRLIWKNYRGTHLVPLNAKQEIRWSPVSANLAEYLDALPTNTDRIFASFDRVAARAKSRGLILSTERRMQAANNIADKWFKRVCELAGLPCGRAQHGLTFHSFRHTGATWQLNGSETRRPVSVRTVMELGGWKNVKLFMRTYCHTDQKSLDTAVANMFPNGLPGKPRGPRIVRRADEG